MAPRSWTFHQIAQPRSQSSATASKDFPVKSDKYLTPRNSTLNTTFEVIFGCLMGFEVVSHRSAWPKAVKIHAARVQDLSQE